MVDGLFDDDTCDRLLNAADRRGELATKRGSVRGWSNGEHFDLSPEHKWVRGGVDQSNSIAFVNDRYAMKLFRRIAPSVNPEFEIGRFLSARGFTRTPALVGALEYDRVGLEPGTLAVVQAVVKHQGSGWEFSIDELRRYYERVSARIGLSDEPFAGRGRRHSPLHSSRRWNTGTLGTATTLGRRTAELHLALASGTGHRVRSRAARSRRARSARRRHAARIPNTRSTCCGRASTR